MGLLDKVRSAFVPRVREGEPTAGGHFLPITGGWLSPEASQYANWWQMDYQVEGNGRTAMVEACIAAYAQTVAMCPGAHWRWSQKAGRHRIAGSALTRIIKSPNDYQSISDWLLNAIYGLLGDGNAYALVIRNARFEPQELHLMNPRQCAARIGVDGSVFYQLGGNEIVDRRFGSNLVVPARDVLHLRLHTPRHPLVGESPLAAAALQMAAGNAALTQQVTFFLNQSRPSFILTTDKDLKLAQIQELREAWEQQSRGLNQGRTPILSNGLKAVPLGTNAHDAQLAELLKLSDQAIANVFRVPLQVLGVADKTPYASTEALMQSWRAGGLGFVLNHIEEALGLLFKLGGQPEEYVEFDTSALLRSAFRDRVEAWSNGVRGGVFARNEARADFEFAAVEYGDEPWVQQQDVPLSVAGRLAEEGEALVAEPLKPATDDPADGKPVKSADQVRELDVHFTRSLADAA